MDIWKKQPAEVHWLACPHCLQPHLIRFRDDTILVNYPAWCKKCKRESIITLENDKIEP